MLTHRILVGDWGEEAVEEEEEEELVKILASFCRRSKTFITLECFGDLSSNFATSAR